MAKKQRSWKTVKPEKSPELQLPPAIRKGMGLPPDPGWHQAAELALKKCHERYNSGDKGALFDALEILLTLYPSWLQGAFSGGWRAYREGRAQTLEAAFGIKWSTAARKREQLRESILARVYELHREGKPIDAELFAIVGKELGCSGSTVAKIFGEPASDELRERHRRVSLDKLSD